MKMNRNLSRFFSLVRRYSTLIQWRLGIFRLPTISMPRIVIGPGGTSYYAGWLSLEYPILDVTKRESFEQFWQPNSLESLVAEHVWEHLSSDEREKANANCYTFLKSGGRLRLAVPDGNNPSDAYIERVKPNGSGPGCEDHKILFTIESMTKELLAAGFNIVPLEYFDVDGVFRETEWSVEYGYIRRSYKHDPRNDLGKLVYSSIIVDAIKP